MVRWRSVGEELRWRAMRKPSRERNRIVLDRRSSWIVAKPNVEGEVCRRISWLNVNVRRRVKSWSRIR